MHIYIISAVSAYYSFQ